MWTLEDGDNVNLVLFVTEACERAEIKTKERRGS